MTVHEEGDRIDPGTSGSGINALADPVFAAVGHCVTVSAFKFSGL